MKNHPILSLLLAFAAGFFFYSLGYVWGVQLLLQGPFPLPSLLKNPQPHPLTDTLAALAVVSAAVTAAKAWRGNFLSRWIFLFVFLYVPGQLIGAIESAFFTKFGGTRFLMALGFLPSLLGSLGVALFIREGEPVPFLPQTRRFFHRWKPEELARRLALAWIAFPAIYLFFGTLVAPIVKPFYLRLDFLAIPPMGTLLAVQMCRSFLILAAVLPLFIQWEVPKGRKVLAFGWAFYALTGLNGLLSGYFLPDTLRWVHGVETLADAAAYAAVMAFLF